MTVKGFQGSETSRVEVTIYSFGDEPGLIGAPTITELNGASLGGGPALSSLNVEKTLGAPAGTFLLEVKADAQAQQLFEGISDDDWVDIVITRNGARSHVMRGQIDSIKYTTSVDGSGATSRVVQVAGSDFGRIFALTPIWFDIMTKDDIELTSFAMSNILSATGLNRDPLTTTRGVMAGFIRELNKSGKTKWQLPSSMPGVLSELSAGGQDAAQLQAQNLGADPGLASFLAAGASTDIAYALRNMAFYGLDYIDHPNRSGAIAYQLFPDKNQSVWEYTMRWADLPVCELYTELLAPGTTRGKATRRSGDLGFGIDETTIQHQVPVNDPTLESELLPEHSAMTVVFRDRPFPTYSRALDGKTPEPIGEGPWFKQLQTYEISDQHVVAKAVGRTGHVRKNAFYATPKLFHERADAHFSLQQPLWRPDDILRHGFRRMDVTFDYTSAALDIFDMTRVYRQRIRDFHCMDHLFLSGRIALGHGRPDIRVGQKLKILSTSGVEEQYYIESWRHVWNLQQGVRTDIGVSRGWLGTDETLIEAMNEIVGLYHTIEVGTGLDVPPPELNGPAAVDPSADRPEDHAEAYPPFSPQLIALFRAAAVEAGVPTTWADPADPEGNALHSIMAGVRGKFPGENNRGWVGWPNYTYGARARKFSQWAVIWSEIRAGQLNRSSSGEVLSTATGLGQLLVANVRSFYPSGVAGIGVAREEAVGMLKYIKSTQLKSGHRFTTPIGAYACKLATGVY